MHHRRFPVEPCRFLANQPGAVAARSGHKAIAIGAANRSQCAGRRIYVRDLPSGFNADLLATCDDFPILFELRESQEKSLLPFLANHGLGPLTYNRSRSWYRTEPLFFELLFHRRLREYSCLVADPVHADAVFVPYYTALAALPYLYSPTNWNDSGLHGRDLADWLLRGDRPTIWSRRGGHDHFVAVAGSAWDFDNDPDQPPLWGTAFLGLPELYNLTAIALESRAWPLQEHAVPPPTSFHPATVARLEAWLTRARRSRRPLLMLFAGGAAPTGGRPNIASSIHAECDLRPDLCELVDCSKGSCVHEPARFMRPMLRARFCLQPPSETPTRRSTFDGILAGCIPVFFEEASAERQFGWHLPRRRYDDFSVTIPKEEVVFGGRRIVDVLQAIPPARVLRMREAVLELAPTVIYRRHGSSAALRARKDAFDVAVDGVLRRIRRRVREMEQGKDPLLLVDEDDDETWTSTSTSTSTDGHQ
ncbi:hypothetical protein ZIOFF_070896 [Zingiber officinale]|uniref:Exostosin GT47 domain-containing protein n=1 Tax=Zingiber officinale TaxID=94328 RepID=A0A8J5C960_ZINOF|nr:hypothetical protein ZIOFF_070896 [Zingiber officinale]